MCLWASFKEKITQFFVQLLQSQLSVSSLCSCCSPSCQLPMLFPVAYDLQKWLSSSILCAAAAIPAVSCPCCFLLPMTCKNDSILQFFNSLCSCCNPSCCPWLAKMTQFFNSLCSCCSPTCQLPILVPVVHDLQKWLNSLCSCCSPSCQLPILVPVVHYLQKWLSSLCSCCSPSCLLPLLVPVVHDLQKWLISLCSCCSPSCLLPMLVPVVHDLQKWLSSLCSCCSPSCQQCRAELAMRGFSSRLIPTARGVSGRIE